MSTQWKKLSEEQQPKIGQPIWYRHSTWAASNRSSFMWHWDPSELKGLTQSTFLWCEAVVPDPPPCESEAAFNEWWSNYGTAPTGPFLTAKDFSKVAWDAALAWHKNKTKE